MKLCFLAPLLLALPATAQTPWSTFIDPTRAIDWSTAGFTIPSYSTACATTVSLTPSSSGAAAANAASITAALASCDATHNVVNIPAGTYYVAGFGYGTQGKQVLRGAGANSTFLISTSEFGCGFFAGICMNSSNGTYNQTPDVQPPSGISQCLWTGGLSQGSTSITLSSCGGTPPVNQVIILDQANDTSDTGGVYICDTNIAGCGYEGSSGGNNNGRFISGKTHSQQQTDYVTGVTSLGGGSYTVTLADPVYFTNVRAGRDAGAWWPGFVQNDGLENLSIDGSADPSETMIMYSCYQCWVKGVRFLNGARSSVFLFQSSHSVIRDSYFYGAQGDGSESYTIEAEGGSSANLVENSIFQNVTAPNLLGSGTGFVFGYNYGARTSLGGSFSNGAYVSHNAGNEMNLYEGNNFNSIFGDDAWGSSTQSTYFRNMLRGWQSGKTFATETIMLRSWMRAFNMVGNVLGQPGYHTNYQTIATSGTTLTGTPEATSIYSLGSSDIDACNISGVLCDPKVVSTLMRWGNYDTVTAANKWDSTEASPGAVTYVAANFSAGYFTGLAHTLPSSLYYASTPSWWPSGKTWPPIGPNTTTGNVGTCLTGTYMGAQATTNAQCGGGGLVTSWASHVVSIPAQDCALSLGMPPDGSGSALAFDATTCYASTPTAATPVFSPTTLASPGWVGISCSTPSSRISYTTDGSTPTGASTQFVTNLYIAASQTVKAICTKAGSIDSAVASQAFAPTITPKFYISANGASDIPSPYPFINRSVAAEWEDVLTTPASNCNTYNWAPLDSWIAQSVTHSSVNMYTFSHIPQCANGTTNNGNPPTDIGSGNIFFRNFVDKLMEHLGGISSIPGSPTSYTTYSNTLYFELWNESNVGRYWTSTDANMAIMWTTAMTEIRKFCSDCIIIGGSTSAGGKGNEYYYTASLGILQALGTQKPDVVSFHPYPSRTTVKNAPFPDTITSINDAACTGTPNVSCDVAVGSEVTYFRQHVLQDVSIAPWAGKLGVTTSEGGYGINDAIYDYAIPDWNEAHTNPAFLRAAYASQWEIAMEDQGTLWNLWYVDKDQCWGTVTWNGTSPGSGCPNTPAATITAPSQTSLALTQTNTWLQSGVPSGPKVCTGGTPFTQVCTLPMTIGGNPAEIKYYTGWLTSHSQSTTFTTQQTIQGTTSATGGTVVLTQEPILLTSPASTFTLSTATAGTGTGTITGCAGTYAASAAYSCTVAAGTGSTLTSVTGCGGSGTTTYTGTMPSSNCTVTATFTINTYTLTTTTAGTGTGTIGTCIAGTYNYNTSITCTQSASTGTFTVWSGGVCSGSGACTFNITANSTVTATFSLTVATPVLAPTAGTYFSAQSVTITDATAGSSIFYTTDGSTPTTGSTPYTGAITVSSTTTVKAIASKAGYINSSVASALYTISSPGSTNVSISGGVKISGTVGVQ